MTKLMYVTLLGWEPRSWLGTKRNLHHRDVHKFFFFFFEEYRGFTDPIRKELEYYCKEKNIEPIFVTLTISDPLVTWRAIAEVFSGFSKYEDEVILDITTMPREIIWNCLHFFNLASLKGSYSYHLPEKYGKWLSRDAGTPRLIYKHSGIIDLDKPTALVAVTGFDSERTECVLNFFNPEQVNFIMHSWDRFQNKLFNIARHKKFTNRPDRYHFSLHNCYDVDSIYRATEKAIKNLSPDFNVVLVSLGPKLTAISLFRAQLQFPETCLCYIPSKEYNPRYSMGIGESYSGLLNLSP